MLNFKKMYKTDDEKQGRLQTRALSPSTPRAVRRSARSRFRSVAARRRAGAE